MIKEITTRLVVFTILVVSHPICADETVSGTLTVDGNMIVLRGYEKLYIGSSHNGGSDNRSFFAPMKPDGNGYDWSREFGFHNTNQAWYFESNLGIGTHSPSEKLEVRGNIMFRDGILFGGWSNGTSGFVLEPGGPSSTFRFDSDRLRFWTPTVGEVMTINETRSVGIGTATPQALLEVGGQVRVTGLGPIPSSGRGLEMYWSNSTGTADIFAYDRDARAMQRLRLRGSTVIVGANSVGIGTDDPRNKLDVNGTIRAKEVIVESGWADYVFEEGYELMPLNAVEAHIRVHRRLPGLPSAAEVAEQGVSLAESQRLLLEKIEELTLHTIELQKRNVVMENELRNLKELIE